MPKSKRVPGSQTADFPALLERLMEEGVRPTNSDRRGIKWSQKELATACGRISTREVWNWLNGVHLPRDTDILELAFFGRDQSSHTELRARFRAAIRNTGAIRHNRSAYADMSTVIAIWRELKKEIGLQFRDGEELYAENVKQVSWLINQLHGSMNEGAATFHANAARANVFDAKYGDWSAEDDERRGLGLERWNEEILALFHKYRINFDSKLLVVGLGPGLEGVGIYDRFSEFSAIDISKNAVRRSSLAFPNANIVAGSAEDLPASFANFDCYVSLKTFSSSFFDIDSAVQSCSQCLRSGGHFICSIPKGYNYKDDDFIPGISRTNYRYIDSEDFITYSYPDKILPLDLIRKIANSLYQRLFTKISVETGLTEYYIIARKK